MIKLIHPLTNALFYNRYFRLLFVTSYFVQGTLLTAILIRTTQDSAYKYLWSLNIISDVAVITLFLIYYRYTHVQRANSYVPSKWSCLFPNTSYVLYPTASIISISTAMVVNLYIVRIPAIYYHAQYMLDVSSTNVSTASNTSSNSSTIYTYDNALLLVNLSIITIGSLAMYWSVSFMLFKNEFTRSPGK